MSDDERAAAADTEATSKQAQEERENREEAARTKVAGAASGKDVGPEGERETASAHEK